MSQGETDPKTTLVVVTRDRAAVLPGCIDALASQIPAPHQVVLVAGNNASVPAGFVERYGDLLITLAACASPNISIARNIGLDQAQGELVIFVDDDAQAHPGLLRAYRDAFRDHPRAWAGAGFVLDSRQSPPSPEFEYGMIRPDGVQIPVRQPNLTGLRRGYFPAVKGCNFALHRTRMPTTLRFDPFFAFAYDEADLIMSMHEQGGEVVHVPGAVVDHAHAPGMYRDNGPLNRDWHTEFASHTMFMLKHTQGRCRWWGWCVVYRRLAKHIVKVLASVLRAEINSSQARDHITRAFHGIKHAQSSHDSVRSSR